VTPRSRRRRFTAAAEDEFGNKIRRPPRGFTERHAESEKILGVHRMDPNLSSQSTEGDILFRGNGRDEEQPVISDSIPTSLWILAHPARV
jgi:hypothetical protein